jgi:YfiR/HmsC-like
MMICRYPPATTTPHTVPRAGRPLAVTWRLSCLLGIAGILIAGARPAMAQQSAVRREYAIKAGVIGVLAKCINWPPNIAPAQGEPLIIGIYGKDPFFENGANQLDELAAAANLKGNKIVVIRFNSDADYEPCHILFISSLPSDQSAEQTVEQRLQAAQRLVGDAPVLILGESPGLAQQGAVGNLIFDRANNRIRLELNPDTAVRIGLKLAPDLLRLRLVQIVRDQPR